MLQRFREAMSPAALLVAVLALVIAGAGIGWTAATVGTGRKLIRRYWPR